MVKAKDILNKSPEDFEDDPLEKDEKKDEGERVNEAYESLSKKLEDIRNGKKDEEESEESEDTDPSTDAQDKEDEHEIEKPKEDEEELAPEEPKHTFIKAEEDPLDKDADLSEEEVKKENESEETDPSTTAQDKEPDEADTLEDLIKEDEEESTPKMEKSVDVASDVPQKPVFPKEEMGIPALGANQPSRPPYSSYPPRFGSNRPVAKSASKWHVVILLLIGLAVIGGTVYFLKNQFKSTPQTQPPASSTPVPTPTPSPTPEPLDRAQFKIRVLNGTTTSGLAATVSTKLEELGYGKDRTGNATNSAFERTEIRVKAAKVELVEQLIRDLAPDYDAASSSSPLKDSDAADAEVIIGQT